MEVERPLHLRLARVDEVADARAIVYAGELRACLARFRRDVAGEQLPVSLLDDFLFEVHAICDRMDAGLVLERASRRPQVSVDEFDSLTREPA